MIEVAGTLLILGALLIGFVGTPALCLVVGAWRSMALVHIEVGLGVAVGLGVGIGAVGVNIVVAVIVYFALVNAAPVISGDWGMLWVAIVCPFLTAPLAVIGTWRVCERKNRREQTFSMKATTVEVK